MTCPHCGAEKYRKDDTNPDGWTIVPFYESNIELLTEDGDCARLYACPECNKTFIKKEEW